MTENMKRIFLDTELFLKSFRTEKNIMKILKNNKRKKKQTK